MAIPLNSYRDFKPFPFTSVAHIALLGDKRRKTRGKNPGACGANSGCTAQPQRQYVVPGDQSAHIIQ